MAFTGYPDGAKALAELYRVLKPGGKLLMVDIDDYYSLFVFKPDKSGFDEYIVNEKTGKRKFKVSLSIKIHIKKYIQHMQTDGVFYSLDIDGNVVTAELFYIKFDNEYLVFFVSEEIPFYIISLLSVDEFEFSDFLKLPSSKKVQYKSEWRLVSYTK